jgi:hypothetical protein
MSLLFTAPPPQSQTKQLLYLLNMPQVNPCSLKRKFKGKKLLNINFSKLIYNRYK